jgi:hypothetical protein
LSLSAAVVEISKAGLYRLDAGSHELRVYGGAALVTCGDKKVTTKSGRMAHLDGKLASSKFNANDTDSLHKWAAKRSFDLFTATYSTRKQIHWTPVSLGWLHNSNFRMRFHSQLAFDELTRDRQHQEDLERMQVSQSLERIEQAEQAAQAARIEQEMRAAQEAQAAQQQGSAEPAPAPSPQPAK